MRIYVTLHSSIHTTAPRLSVPEDTFRTVTFGNKLINGMSSLTQVEDSNLKFTASLYALVPGRILNTN